MPSSSAAASSTELLRFPPRQSLLFQQRLASLSLCHSGEAARRRQAGLAPPSDHPGEPRSGEVEVAAADEEDFELEEELLLAGADDEEEGDTAALLFSASSSPSQPLPLLPALGSVLLSFSFDVQETAEPLCGADEPQSVMAAMLSHAFDDGGTAGLNGEPTALLRQKSVNTTECVPVPSSEHVAEIVGRQGTGPQWIPARAVRPYLPRDKASRLEEEDNHSNS